MTDVAPLSRKAKDRGRRNVWGADTDDCAPELPDIIERADIALHTPTKTWPAELLNHPDVRPFIQALAALKEPFDKFVAATAYTDAERAEEALDRERKDAPRLMEDAKVRIAILKHLAAVPVIARDYPAEIAAEEARVKRCRELLGETV